MKTLREEALEKVKSKLLKYQSRDSVKLFHGASLEDLTKEELLKVLDVMYIICTEVEDSENNKYVESIFLK